MDIHGFKTGQIRYGDMTTVGKLHILDAITTLIKTYSHRNNDTLNEQKVEMVIIITKNIHKYKLVKVDMVIGQNM